MSRLYLPGDNWQGVFSLTSGGQLVDADATPTLLMFAAGVYDNTVSFSLVSPVPARDPGWYAASCIIPVTYPWGTPITIGVEATVNGVKTGGVVDAFRLYRPALGAVGTVAASPTPTSTSFSGGSLLTNENDAYTGTWCVFLTGHMAGEAPQKVTSYVGASRLVTVASPFLHAPQVGDQFVLIGRAA